MIGAIIGDIVGSRFEFGDPPQKGFELFTQECNYTDDTICTVAVADAVLRGIDYGQSLKEWCRRYPNPMGGYGNRFYHWLFDEGTP
jgi:ADP-ribosylglycohydrolase